MKTVNVLGGTATVNDTFEVRASRDEFFDIGMAFNAAKKMHPELETICMLNTRYVDADGSSVAWNDPSNTGTIWTFELPATEQPTGKEALVEIIDRHLGIRFEGGAGVPHITGVSNAADAILAYLAE